MKALMMITIAVIGCALWNLHTPASTLLSVCIDQTFDKVVKESSFPVTAASNIPAEATQGSGATWVTEPAVIIHFSDPQYGFTLPPTSFAGISYMDYKVRTIDTSPMLKKLTFDEVVVIARSLQQQFQTKGWQLDNQSRWLDLRMENQQSLRRSLRQIGSGYRADIELIAPKKYSMFFRIYCAARCDSQIGLDRYLIDISIGKEYSDR